MLIEVDETLEIPVYTETQRYSDLKNKVFKMAVHGEPFHMPELPSAEYKYYSTMWHIFKRLTAKEITPEQATEENRIAFKQFSDEQALYNQRLWDCVQWQKNIKDSESLRCQLAHTTDKDTMLLILAEIAEKLTKDSTILAVIQRIIEEAKK